LVAAVPGNRGGFFVVFHRKFSTIDFSSSFFGMRKKVLA
jgi:hypothetical protein